MVDSRDDGVTQDTHPSEAAQVNPRCDVADSGGNPRGAAEESRYGSDPSGTILPDAPPGYFPVERIVQRRADPVHGHIYRVRWKGYGPEDDTWQCGEDFPTSLLIEEFESSVREKRSSSGGNVVATAGRHLSS